MCVCAQSLSPVGLFEIHQAPLSMGFPRQEYRSGLPCPPPGDLPNLGIEPVSLASPALAGGFFTTSTTWEAPIFYFLYRHFKVYHNFPLRVLTFEIVSLFLTRTISHSKHLLELPHSVFYHFQKIRDLTNPPKIIRQHIILCINNLFPPKLNIPF